MRRRPKVRLSFANGIPAGVTFARASGAYAVNSSGLWVPLSSGQPPLTFSHDGSRWRGYVPFGQRTNLLAPGSTSDLTTAAWTTPASFSVTANAGIGAMGTQTMSLVTDNSAGAEWIYQVGNLPAVDTKLRCFKSELKAGTTDIVRILAQTAGGGANIDFATFTLSGAGSVTPGISPAEYLSIKRMGNDVYQCSIGLPSNNDTVAAIGFSAGPNDASTGSFYVENAGIEDSPEAVGAIHPSGPLDGGATRQADTAVISIPLDAPMTLIAHCDVDHIPNGLSYVLSLSDTAVAPNFTLVNVQSVARPFNNAYGAHVMGAGANLGGEHATGTLSADFPRCSWGVVVADGNHRLLGRTAAPIVDAVGGVPSGLYEWRVGQLGVALDNGWFNNGIRLIEAYSGVLSDAEITRLLQRGF